MRRARSLHRCVAMAFLAAAGFGLGACEQMADLIPDSKKPLPGERRLLFPEGVPGVTQGVPPELMRGNQQVQGQTAPGQTAAPADPQAQQQPAEQQQAEEKPKPKPKPKVQRTVRQQPRQEPQPEPAQPQQPQQQQSSPWPAPQQQPTQPSPWPSAPAPGTFTR
jgi:outer membrane biosynthesis protein TonB